jgi:hypothetical protein
MAGITTADIDRHFENWSQSGELRTAAMSRAAGFAYWTRDAIEATRSGLKAPTGKAGALLIDEIAQSLSYDHALEGKRITRTAILSWMRANKGILNEEPARHVIMAHS